MATTKNEDKKWRFKGIKKNWRYPAQLCDGAKKNFNQLILAQDQT